jgi:hypothetical protein
MTAWGDPSDFPDENTFSLASPQTVGTRVDFWDFNASDGDLF